MKLKTFIIIILMLLSGVMFYYAAENYDVVDEEVFVSRVIDGDTFELDDGRKVRMLGINCPERSMEYYDDAKVFLESLILNKNVLIESREVDQYGRFLAHVFFDGVHVNKEILKKGFANLYYYGEDFYFDEMERVEREARNLNLGIWKKSSNFNCVSFISLKFEETERCKNQEQLVLFNSCDKISIKIKDEATHIFDEVLENGLFVKNFSCIWNNDGDSLFIWDDEGLVVWWGY